MPPLFRLLGGVLLLLVAAAPARAQPSPLVRVNGDAVYPQEFDRSYAALLVRTGADDRPARRLQHLQDMVDQVLLAQEARRRDLHHTPELQALREQALRQALSTRYFEQQALDTLPDVTDADLRRAYRHAAGPVAVRHLFFTDADAAQAAYARLLDGRDFLEEAQHVYGLPRPDSSAGYLGLIDYFDVDDAFAEVAFGLAVGAFSPPFQSRQGWHIVRVEERLRQPLFSETAYQTQRGKLRQQLRQRRRRLAGDAFVRTFMAQQHVEAEDAAVAALARALVEAPSPAPAPGIPVHAAAESPALDSEAVASSLNVGDVLAVYGPAEARRTFTVADYLRWLPSLPHGEARDRPAASVGRALRNEALAEAAREAGLAADSLVQREVVLRHRVHLAARLSEALHALPPPSPNERGVSEALTAMRARLPRGVDELPEAWLRSLHVLTLLQRLRAEADLTWDEEVIAAFAP